MQQSSVRYVPRRAAWTRLCVATLGVIVALGSTGCAVPQPRGAGQLDRIVDPGSSRGYWRYLPKPYIASSDAERKSRRWPLVVTFHGMKPFDNAHPQACEWQLEADRFGYVVIAPELRAPDVLLQFPVREVHPAFKGDEVASLAIMDHVFATTDADRSNVLSTSWSSGGYMAHYMVNRYPDRFTCLAVRQSNFSGSIMDATLADRSRRHPILIVNTQNDFAICLEESRQAREWYAANGYSNVAWIKIKHLGHERTPDLAADFFGRVAGVEPGFAPSVLVQRQAIEGNAEGLAFFAGKSQIAGNAQRSADATPVARNAPARPETPSRSRPVRSGSDGVNTNRLPSDDMIAAAATPNRGNAVSTAERPRRSPLAIRVSSAIGLQPMSLSFWAEAPSDWAGTASFQWTLDGQTIGNGLNGQKSLPEAGEFTLGLLAVTTDGSEHRVSRSIRVLPKSSASAAGIKP